MNLKWLGYLACLPSLVIPLGCDREPEPRPVSVSGDLGARFEALVPELLARSPVPGVQIAVIDEGVIAWHGSYGFAGNQLLTPDTSR